MGFECRLRGHILAAIQELGDAEIKNLNCFFGSRPSEENIFRFQVTMQEMAPVSGIHGRAYSAQDLKGTGRIEPLRAHQFIAQRTSFEQLHYKESPRLRLNAVIMHSYNV